MTILLNNVTVARNTIALTQLSGAAASATNGTAVDVSDAEGNILVVLTSTAASTSDTFTLTVEESADGSTSWGAIPADSLFDPNNHAAATFTVVTDAATAAHKHQILAIRKGRVKRYLRAVMTYAGSSISGAYCVDFIVRAKLANWTV